MISYVRLCNMYVYIYIYLFMYYYLRLDIIICIITPINVDINIFSYSYIYLSAPCGASTAALYFCVSAFCCSCWRFGGHKLWVAVVMLELCFLRGRVSVFHYFPFCHPSFLSKTHSKSTKLAPRSRSRPKAILEACRF